MRIVPHARNKPPLRTRRRASEGKGIVDSKASRSLSPDMYSFHSLVVLRYTSHRQICPSSKESLSTAEFDSALPLSGVSRCRFQSRSGGTAAAAALFSMFVLIHTHIAAAVGAGFVFFLSSPPFFPSFLPSLFSLGFSRMNRMSK